MCLRKGCWLTEELGEQGGLSEREGDGERPLLLSERGDVALQRKLACGATELGFSSKRK